jgi:hypothetical protein
MQGGRGQGRGQVADGELAAGLMSFALLASSHTHACMPVKSISMHAYHWLMPCTPAAPLPGRPAGPLSTHSSLKLPSILHFLAIQWPSRKMNPNCRLILNHRSTMSYLEEFYSELSSYSCQTRGGNEFKWDYQKQKKKKKSLALSKDRSWERRAYY